RLARLVVCLVLVLWFPLLPVKHGLTQINSAGEVLVAGAVSSAVLGAGETKTYFLDVQAEQHCRLEILRRDIALKVTICVELTQTCLEFVRRDYGPLDVSFTAPTANRYRLLVTSIEKDAGKRGFELRVLQVVTATQRENSVDVATRALSEAESLKEQNDASSRLAAISKYDEVRRMWELVGERGKAAEALCNAGDVYFSLGQYRLALGRYREALDVGKAHELARLRALNGIGYMHAWLGENDRALDYAERVRMDVERLDGAETSAPHIRIKAQAINTIGEVYYARRKLRESLEVFESTIALWKKAEARDGEALALLNIGYSYGDLGEFRK